MTQPAVQLCAAARGATLAEQQLFVVADELAALATAFAPSGQQALPPLAQQAAPATQQSGACACARGLAAQPELTAKVTTANTANTLLQTIKLRVDVDMEHLLKRNLAKRKQNHQHARSIAVR
jgi:hypothetical protein